MRLHLILFFILLAGTAYCQTLSQKDQELVEQINNYMDAISNDSSLQKIVIDSVLLIDKFDSSKAYYKVNVYLKDKEIVRMILIPFNGVSFAYYTTSNSAIDCFITEQGPKCIIESYANSSRMGSCGMLNIENRVYYHKGEVLTTKISEQPFACYHNKIQLEWLYNNYLIAYNEALKSLE